MVRKAISVTLDKDKIKVYKGYCKETGRSFSLLVEVAIEKYIKEDEERRYPALYRKY